MLALVNKQHFVQCGTDTITQNDIDQGIVNIVVGFAGPVDFRNIVLTPAK